MLHLQKYLADDALGLIVTNERGEPVIDAATNKRRLIDPKDSGSVFIDVTAYNSTFYYVQGDGVLIPGRMQVTGRETILDAINLVGGLSPQADHNGVVLHRHDSKGALLPPMHIDIDQIMLGDDLSTNYQLKPGDRLVVPRVTNFKPDDARTEVEHPKQESPQQSRHSRYFPRLDTPTGKLATVRDRPSDNASSLRRVEARLSDVERKIDLILEALKPRTP